MRRILHTVILVLLALSCTREAEPCPVGEDLPIGVPTMLTIPFGSDDLMQVEVGTKADAGFINESNIHDLYVFLFDKKDIATGSARKIYGRYFNFDHKRSSLAELNSHNNECWYVENKSIGSTNKPTRGAVKISTVTREDVALVVLANVANSVMEMDSEDEITRLNQVEDLDELRGMTVSLEQDIVNRKDLFLMMGTLGYNDGRTISTGSMHWNRPAPTDLEYDPNYKVELRTVNAKVKFRIKVNSDYISAVTPVYWQVCRTPNSCHLFSDYNDEKAPESIYYFDSQTSYFEDKEIDGDDTYYTFCFYMLENRLSPAKEATNYYQRELQAKTVSPDDGYAGKPSDTYGTHFVDNGDWEYANPNSTYVKFDLVLTLTPEGIANLGADDPSGMTLGHALTSDAIFTVHLGDFTSSAKEDGWAGFNDYNTKRGYSYTYNITVNNTKSIFTEVVHDDEAQAGQEGFLLLTDDEIINADAHYEYHQLTFAYRPDMQQEKFSWYVKTPFSDGGPKITFDEVKNKFVYSTDGLDYLWVKFGINNTVDGSSSQAPWDDDKDPTPWGTVNPYSKRRHKYPGDSHYDPAWEPGQQVSEGVPVNHGPSDPNDPMYRMIPDLMDITQLIRYIFWETARETAHREDSNKPESAFIADDGEPDTVPVIRFTAFIDEYYYEEHPIEHTVDPDLWRQFVNAQPREMHILSDAQQSRDRKSDVILSSHSIIQQSIQTIYNIYAADLHTLWGTEHEDEMRKLTDGWPYWPNDPLDGKNGDESTNARSGDYYTELGKWNGRLNSAYIWDFYSTKTATGQDRTDRTWETFLDYSVHNEIPELKAPSGGDNGYQGMAYSCLTRNRDNNGDGVVDRSEIRWYLAACNQLAGMWVGNESLSINARLYKPSPGQWRAHIMSSSGKRVSWSEEGGGATDYNWDFTANRYTWPTIGEAAKGESVRCLRNIGTFTDNGEIKDISYAPYNYEIEHYFTMEDQGEDAGEGPYVFHFDRLNPKSIRQLSESELPYADQFNLFNCVYLKFETQGRADDVVDFNIINTVNTISETNPDNYPTNETINPEVTQLGQNPYCPPGYRFPNHSEMLLMSLYLPTAYFECDKDGVAYADGAHLPTRTYYDRGYYGNNRTGMTAAEISRERGKAGWGYTSVAHKQSCLQRTQTINHSRCVRDTDMTGWIDGDLKLPSDNLCPGDPTQLSFSFYSSAASFVSASLEFCYTDGNGVYHEQDIPIVTPPSGLQFMASQIFTLPTLTEVGLDEDKLDEADWKFKMTLRNTTSSRTFEHPFSLSSHMTRCSVTLPSVSDPVKGMPVRVNIGSRNAYAKLTDVTLHWKASDEDGDFHTKVLDKSGNISSYSKDVYLKDIIGNSWDTEANRFKEYQFYVTASCSDGTSYVSPTIANQILKLNYCLNPVPEGGWTSINQCQGTWTEEVTGLNFANGDFIEVDMDLRNCRYKYLTGTAATDLGQDNIIGFSADNFDTPGEAANTKTIKNSIIWYYPSVEHLVNSDNPADWGWIRSRVHAGKWSANTPDEGVLSAMNLILDKDGLIRDGSRWTRNPGDWNSRIKPLLTNSSSLWLGSVEGVHHSRATYNFIRVVRVKDPAVTPVPRD